MPRNKISKQISFTLLKYFTFQSLNNNVRIVQKMSLNNWRPNVDLEMIAFAVKAHLVEFWEEAASSPQMGSNPRSKEINWKSIGLFSNASSLGWVGQINDGASRYKGGAGVRKAANGHICTRPNQKCKKSTFVPDQTRNVKNLHLYQTKPEM